MSYKSSFFIVNNRRIEYPYYFANISIEEKESLECSICLENYTKGGCIKLESCGHMYHEKCITECLKFSRACPLCRRIVDDVTCDCIIL